METAYGHGRSERKRAHSRAGVEPEGVLVLDSRSHSDSLERSVLFRLAGRLSKSGIRADVLSSAASASRLATMRELIRRAAYYECIHVLYTGGRFMDVVGIPALIGAFFRRRLVLHYHNYDAEADLQRNGPLRSLVLRLFSTILTPNQFLVEPLSAFTSDVQVVPDSISSVLPGPRLIEKLQPHILTVGPLETASNISSLIRAFRVIKAKYPRAELTVAGDGQLRRQLESETYRQAPNGVSFVGDVDLAGLCKLMNQADVLTWVGVQEVSPRSLQLAMGCGLPVLSTSTAGASELITDGVDGLLVPVGDHNTIARRLLELIESPEFTRRVSEAAAQTAARRTWESVGDRWLGLYGKD